MIRAHFVFVIALIFSACQADIQELHSGPQEVGFYVGGNNTRTEMLQNGLSAVWSANDELALWARNSAGTFTLSEQVFKTYGIDGRSGYFTSTLSSSMPEDDYTYFCSYPLPESVSGTKATFTLPALQDGKVSGGADIMIAEPVKHGALTALQEVEDHSGMSMQMHRMMHQFRFYLPEDNSIMNGESITRIELVFPRKVAGEVEMDLSDPDLLPSLDESGGTDKVVLSMAEPLTMSRESEGEYDFACVALAPVTFAAGESLSIRAFTNDRIAKIDPVDLCAKQLKPGHSTPVRLVVKDIVDYPYVIRFTLTGNNVGEPVNLIRFTAPSTCVWPTSGTNKYVYDPGRDIAVGETVVFRFADYADYSKFSNQNISIVLETENAISTVTSKVGTVPNGVETHTSDISAAMPYLLYQDFGSISTFSDGHDNPTVGTASDTYTGITELSSCGLPGWFGVRIGIQGGTSARICCRYQHVLLAGAYYKGRLYTPQLSMIKEGKDVKISVSFRHGSNRNERDPLIGSRPDKSPILYFGISTKDVITNPDDNEGDLIDEITGLYAGSGYANPVPTSLSPMVIKGEYLDKENGSYTNLPKSKTVTIDNVDRYMRLGWILTTDNSASNTNANYWFYIDEIKVQLTK
ncbi:MAG: hypothetical protein IKY66_12005 [Bacteroidales bacterium]|nr:hypothetical protein [Bacteroidales bacterium]